MIIRYIFFFIFHYRIMEKNHKLWMFFMNTSGQRNRDISIKVMFWEELDFFFTFLRSYYFIGLSSPYVDHIGGVIVSVLASSAIDPGFEPRSGQTKDYKIGICCFSAKNTSCWLGIRIMCPSGAACLPASGLLFQWAGTIKIQLGILV